MSHIYIVPKTVIQLRTPFYCSRPHSNLLAITRLRIVPISQSMQSPSASIRNGISIHFIQPNNDSDTCLTAVFNHQFFTPKQLACSLLSDGAGMRGGRMTYLLHIIRVQSLLQLLQLSLRCGCSSFCSCRLRLRRDRGSVRLRGRGVLQCSY